MSLNITTLLSRACLKSPFFSVALCILLQACATPTDHLDNVAQTQRFESRTIRSAGFELKVYQNSGVIVRAKSVSAMAGDILHVYLEGDGSPWRNRIFVMRDPTPRSPLMLRLMAMDKQHSIYLGRPCYNGTSEEPECNNRLWTSGRYSDAVVSSMAEAIRQIALRHDASDIRLFGHSGGGALAMLIAQRLPQVSNVITVAGNLDTDAWTRFHSYTPLYGSLNPARQPRLRRDVLQWHLVGGRDVNIPYQLVKPFIASQPEASGILLEGFNHGCCWQTIWPAVLEAVAAEDPRRVPGKSFKLPVSSVIARDSR